MQSQLVSITLDSPSDVVKFKLHFQGLPDWELFPIKEERSGPIAGPATFILKKFFGIPKRKQTLSQKLLLLQVAIEVVRAGIMYASAALQEETKENKVIIIDCRSITIIADGKSVLQNTILTPEQMEQLRVQWEKQLNTEE